MMLLLITQLLLAGPGPVQNPGPERPPERSIELVSHSSRRESGVGEEKLSFSVTVTNHLKSEVGEIELGLVYAATAASLKDLDQTRLYSAKERIQTSPGLLALRETIEARLKPGETRTLGFSRPLSELELNGISLEVFVTHLLGFRLVGASAGELLGLVVSEVAADEWSACEALGGFPGGRTKADARGALRQDPDFVAGLVPGLERTPGRILSTSEVGAWVYGVMALGAHGGPKAIEVLRRLEGKSTLASYDEGIQVLRLARLQNNSFETPLGFVFPGTLTSARQLVAHARDLASAALPEPEVRVSPASGEEEPSVESEVASGALIREESVLWGAFTGGVLGMLAVVVWIRKRRSKRE